GAQGDRAGRAGRGELDEAEVVADMVVVVGVEADLLGVEALGPVHVGDGDRDQLELPVHDHFPIVRGMRTPKITYPPELPVSQRRGEIPKTIPGDPGAVARAEPG